MNQNNINTTIKKLWQQRWICKDIANKLHLSKRNVYNRIYQTNLPRKNKIWTPQENKEIIKLHQKRLTQVQIADKMYARPSQIYGRISKLKLTKKRQNKQLINKLLKKYKKEGFTTKQIAYIIGYSLRRTYQRLEKLGLHKSNKWTPKENTIISKYIYNGTKITPTTIKKLTHKLPNRTYKAIQNKLYDYTPPKKRTSYKSHKWTPKEDAIINKYIIERQHTNNAPKSDINKLMMKLPNRTNKAIENRIYLLNASRVLQLATNTYNGLSDTDIAKIEKIALKRR